MRELLSITILLLLTQWILAQPLSQTIRGTILDKDSQQPLIGATVSLVNLQQGTTTDITGTFRLEKIPLGRQELIISYIGYEEKVVPNLILNAGKEIVLTIYLQESIAELATVVVKASQDKSGSINEMATISARQFSVEEAGRYQYVI